MYVSIPFTFTFPLKSYIKVGRLKDELSTFLNFGKRKKTNPLPPPLPLFTFVLLTECFLPAPPSTITCGPMPSQPLALIYITHHSPHPSKRMGNDWAMASPSLPHLPLYTNYLFMYFLSSFLPYTFIGSSFSLVYIVFKPQALLVSPNTSYDYVLQ